MNPVLLGIVIVASQFFAVQVLLFITGRLVDWIGRPLAQTFSHP